MNAQPFSPWRKRLWPVHGYELKKLIPMVMMFFLIIFNYQLLRDIKDALVVTSEGSGAEIIPFLKFWGVLPSAFLFVMLYMKFSNSVNPSRLFYGSILPFTFFFGCFPIIYMFRDTIHPSELADRLQAFLPQGFMGLIAMFRNWSYSLFYIMAELWGSVALSLLFWGFANATNSIEESKRFYPLFGLLGNMSLPAAGSIIIITSRFVSTAHHGSQDHWQTSLNWLMGAVVLSTLLIMATYRWMHKHLQLQYHTNTHPKHPQMKLIDSIKYLVSSRYLYLLTVLVVCYGFSINLIEVTWKNRLKLQYPDPNDYLEFMGFFTTCTGFFTIFMMLFVGGNMLRRFGWTITALFTPVVLLITGIGFFLCILGNTTVNQLTLLLGTTPLMLSVIFGMSQNILSKASKYAMFDPTKEMAYIPLDEEQKVKGKAAIDVIGARLGKSGGALVQQALIIAFGTISAITPYLGIVLLLIILSWSSAAWFLGKQFKKKTDGNNAISYP
ncbi:ADP,ATP carrier protein 1 [invertebrate metagenome]|uniref:ADP,ATP carrier protein 1 n=1 Tax=invertebrate metagenome TaxID=1711999 RepID=A0A2H9TAH2_9ZZZZ